MRTVAIRVKTLAYIALFLAFVGVDRVRADEALPQEDVALAAFETIVPVMQHPRCINCHTAADFPRFGPERRRHDFNVQRGADGRGTPAFRCRTCHRDANVDGAGVPGAHDWRLAPATAGWGGLDEYDLCRALLDPALNGNLTPRQVKLHLETDPLVRWAWEPGRRADGSPREAPPLSFDRFIAAVTEWVEGGAPCP